jgi:hypothetical protein
MTTTAPPAAPPDVRRPTLQQLLIGDLAPAIRHLDRLKAGRLLPSTAVLDEIEAAIERCVERISREVPG